MDYKMNDKHFIIWFGSVALHPFLRTTWTMRQTQLTFNFFLSLHLLRWPSTSTQEASDIHHCVCAKASWNKMS